MTARLERTLDKIERHLKTIANSLDSENAIETFNTISRVYALIDEVIYTEHDNNGFIIYYDSENESDEMFDLLEKAEIEVKNAHPTAKISYIGLSKE